MKIVRLKDIRKTDSKKSSLVVVYQAQGHIKRYVNDEGYVCFDDDEYNEYRSKKKKVGRPAKNNCIKIGE